MSSALQRALSREIQPSRLAAAVWQWWLDEMRAVVGDITARLLGVETVVAEIGEGESWTLRREAAGGSTLLAGAALENLAASGAAVVVEVPASAALRKTLRLPAAARSNLEALLAFEIGRLTPFAAAQVYRRVEIVRRGPGGELEIELTVVPRGRVDSALARLAENGIAVGAVCVSGTPARDRRRCNLVPGLKSRSALWMPLNRALAAVFGIVALAAAAAPIAAGQWRSAALERELAELRPLIEGARAEQEKRAQGAARRDELLAAMTESPSKVRLLAALTRALPDDCWLTTLAVNGREVIIEGLSPSAAALPQTLESLEGVARVAYAAPVTRDPQTGRERFQFTLQLRRGEP